MRSSQHGRTRAASLVISLLCLTLSLAGCSSAETANSSSAAAGVAGGGGGARAEADREPAANSTVPPNADAAQASDAAARRRIIRDANLALELADPAQAARRVASLAEGSGGFVTSNETRRVSGADDGNAPGSVAVTIVARVPAERFDEVLGAIRKLGERVTSEKITGQDVTEEYLDLEARLRAKQALEAQFLEILKTARTVQDALAVQTQLGEVRAEIEQLEGRRRYLENRTSFSTITVSLEPPAPLLATGSGSFLADLRSAIGGGIDGAAFVLLGLIRVLLALLPLLIFVGLPCALAWRYFRRRAARRALAATLRSESSTHKP